MSAIETRIEIDSRSSKYNRQPYGSSNKKIRREVMLEISEYCNEKDSIFTRNYVNQQANVLRLSEFPEIITEID